MKKSKRNKAAKGGMVKDNAPHYVIVRNDVSDGAPRLPPWGTSSLPELNHGPHATIEATAAGRKAMTAMLALRPGAEFNTNSRPMPIAFMTFGLAGQTREGHAVATAGISTAADAAAALGVSGFFDQLNGYLVDCYPGHDEDVAHLLVRWAEVLLALADYAERNPSSPPAKAFQAVKPSLPGFTAGVLLEAIANFDNLGLGDCLGRVVAASLFAKLSDDRVPDFLLTTTFEFTTRGAGANGPGELHAFTFQGID